MTNAEKYKTPEERYDAFDKFCGSDCTKCQFCKNGARNCKFSWLAAESGEEEKVVTNEQKYKTPEERANAFRKFCDQHVGEPGYSCIGCPAAFRSKTSCDLVWLTLKAED